MAEDQKQTEQKTGQKNGEEKNTGQKAAQNTSAGSGKSSYAEKMKNKKEAAQKPENEQKEEFEQRILDIARVTRVMAGGKRMSFRACVAVGNKRGKVGVGLAKGSDVTLAINKAAKRAKQQLVEVPIVDGTIPHEVFNKYGASKLLFKPARKGKGIIGGSSVRLVLEVSGLTDVSSKILGTENKVSNAKGTIEAFTKMKKPAVADTGQEKSDKNDQ